MKCCINPYFSCIVDVMGTKRQVASGSASSAILFVFFLLGFTVTSQAADRPKIFILYSSHIGYQWTDNIAQGLRSVLRTCPEDPEIYEEYLDTNRYAPDRVVPGMIRFLEYKYRGFRPDVVISADDNAFQQIKAIRRELFPGVPLVFCGVNDYSDELIEGETNVTGVAENFDVAKSIDLVMRLVPEVKVLGIVSDSRDSSRLSFVRLVRLVGKYRDRLEFRFFTERTTEELRSDLRNLPPDSAVLNLSFWRDRAGRTLSRKESLSLLAENSPCPVFALWDFMVGYGVVGGYVANGTEQGRAAAEYALRILRGEKVENLPVTVESPNTYFFDYPALKKWNIPEAKLPKGSVVTNRPESNFYAFVVYFWISVLVIGALIFIAATLAKSRRKWKKAEERVQASLAEKEVLLKEIHHRVKNNLQIISSLLSLQQDSIEDDRIVSYFDDSRNRILSMALIHENLYRSRNLEKIELSRYLGELLTRLDQSYSCAGRGIAVERELEDASADIDTAIPMGLIVTELISNSAKHAFPRDVGGRIRLRLKRGENGGLFLEVQDSGTGLPENFDPVRSSSLGLKLVQALTEQLHGSARWENENGLRVSITFPPKGP